MGRVLICDDAVAYGLLFARWMRDAGITDVSHARNGADGVRLAAELQPVVIVVDHLLPDTMSAELVPRLRRVAPDAKVLLISGMPDDQLAELAEAASVEGHLGKASTADAMRAAVTALMG